MNKGISKQKNIGFTLVETLIYVAIFAMLVGGIATFASNVQSSRLRSVLWFEVNGQGNSIIRTITQSIRNSESINSPAQGNNGSSLSLSMTSPSADPTAFSLTGDTLYITEGGGSPVALSNNKVKVSNLTFSNLSRSTTPGVVQVRFTLSNAAIAGFAEDVYSVDFYGSAALR